MRRQLGELAPGAARAVQGEERVGRAAGEGARGGAGAPAEVGDHVGQALLLEARVHAQACQERAASTPSSRAVPAVPLRTRATTPVSTVSSPSSREPRREGERGARLRQRRRGRHA